jgi:lysozyme family protein
MADFKTAFDLTLIHEGGFQKMPNDAGNWTDGAPGVGILKGTKYGISAHEYPNLDIENLTADDAAAIYEKSYWHPLYAQIQDQPIASKLFDMGVLFGVGTAVKTLQKTLSVIADGVFGPGTLAATNAGDPAATLAYYKTSLVSHALGVTGANPNDRGFFAGWTRRINS